MNKRGVTEWTLISFWSVVGLAVLFLLLYMFGGFTGDFEGIASADSLKDKLTEFKSFGEQYPNIPVFRPLSYLLGNIPQYLVDITSPESAGIVVFGIWLMFFLTFGDIIAVFGLFSKPVAWVSGFVLAVIVANLKGVMLIAVLALTFTAGFGVFSVAASLLIVFVLFLGVNLGIQPLKQLAVARKKGELELRTAMGSTRAAAGLKALKDIERAAEKDE